MRQRPNLLNSVAERARWYGLIAGIVIKIQIAETRVSIALASNPTIYQAKVLTEADRHLGEAVRALQAAVAEIEKL